MTICRRTSVLRRGRAVPRGGGGSSRGYKPGQKDLRTGSAPHGALETLLAETGALGYALTLPEWRAAHERRTGIVLTELDTIAYRLRQRGFVLRVGSRARALRYAPAAAAVPAPVAADPYEELAAVVAEACAATGFATPVGLVQRGLVARGLDRTSDQVRNMLECLSAPSARRAVPGHLLARVEPVVARGAYSVRDGTFWRPVDTSFAPPVDQLLSRAAALRAATSEAATILRRPASPPELVAWAAAHPEHPAASSVRRSERAGVRFTGALRTLLARVRDRPGDLVDCSSPMATDGGLPLRLAVGTVLELDLALSRLTDACGWLLPLTELAACERLRRSEEELYTHGLRALADVRAASTGSALVRAIGWRGPDPISWHLLAERARDAADLLEAWWQQSTAARYPDPPRWLIDAQDAATVAEHAEAIVARGDGSAPAVALAGEAGLRPWAEVEEWLRDALAPVGRDGFKTPQPHLLGVRRFPNPACERGPLHDEQREAFSLLDVGDVLGRLAALTAYAPSLSVLLRCASDLLGCAVRDPAPLRTLLAALPGRDSFHRQGTVVALAALGELVEPGEAIAGPTDQDGLDAYALALGIIAAAPGDRAHRLRSIEPLVASSLYVRLDEMTRRAADGGTVTIAL
jgi:hypothetical protein